MRKTLIFFSFILLSHVGYGQQLTFGSEIAAFSQDQAIPKIAAIWKTYIHSFRSGDPDSVRTDLWIDGSEDIIKYHGFNSLLYNQGEQYTFNIRKLNEDVYEINTLARYNFYNNGDYLINTIYKVCAVEKEGAFKLMNYFDFIKGSLNTYTTECIVYYAPSWVRINKKEAKEAVQFIREFKKMYNVTDKNPITYIVANNMDECSSMLGLTYTLARSEKTHAGRAIYPRILLSARPNHIHELVHAVMLPLYPDAESFLHEGIATYYGGGSQKIYLFHAENVKKYVVANSMDFSSPDNLYKELEDETQLSNTIGALLIAYVLENYGYEKVIALFERKSYEEVFAELGVPKESINDFVLNTLIGQTEGQIKK